MKLLRALAAALGVWIGLHDATAPQQDVLGRRAQVMAAAARSSGPRAAAVALASSIRYSRRRVVASGVRPAPPEIQQALGPYFDAELMADVRWSVSGRGFDLGSLLAGWYLEEGAVTLEDVVVFSNPATARSVGLWAHELSHVEQYRRLGVSRFAEHYVRDWRGLEEEASRNNRRIQAERAAQAGAAANEADLVGVLN
ncbi:MAG TPA: DUF4157 domain-containing protein [Caulobacteraceae bacterium]